MFLPIAIGLWKLISAVLSHPKTFYGYTEKKVRIQTGNRGEKLAVIEMGKIVEISIRSNFFEKAFGTGTIKFFTGVTKTDGESTTKVYDDWESIASHLEVYREVNRVLERRKATIQ